MYPAHSRWSSSYGLFRSCLAQGIGHVQKFRQVMQFTSLTHSEAASGIGGEKEGEKYQRFGTQSNPLSMIPCR